MLTQHTAPYSNYKIRTMQ